MNPTRWLYAVRAITGTNASSQEAGSVLDALTQQVIAHGGRFSARVHISHHQGGTCHAQQVFGVRRDGTYHSDTLGRRPTS